MRLLKILLLIFTSLVIVGCSKDENNERAALSHCADITRVRGAEALVNQVRRVLVLAQKRRREMKNATCFVKQRTVYTYVPK